MMKPPSTNLTLWHELTNQYVYVGAPFPYPEINPHPAFNGFGHHAHTPWGGNGGVSFRKKSTMLQIARSLRCTNPDSKMGDCYEEHIFRTYSAPAQRHVLHGHALAGGGDVCFRRGTGSGGRDRVGWPQFFWLIFFFFLLRDAVGFARFSPFQL